LPSTARSRKKPKKTEKKREFLVTLELMTPVMCSFTVEATSVEAAIEKALQEDWDEYEMGGIDGDGPTYCVEVVEYTGKVPNGKECKIPKKYTAEAVNAAETKKE
jgi:hypothetical protein